jgi:hypothetical protein
MLVVSSYAEDYVDACRAQVAAQLASYRNLLATKRSEIQAFERQFFNHMILALDHYLVHRGRTHGGQGRQSAERGVDVVRWDHGTQGADEREQESIDPEIQDRRRDTAGRGRFRPAVCGVLRRDREDVPVTTSTGDLLPNTTITRSLVVERQMPDPPDKIWHEP